MPEHLAWITEAFSTLSRCRLVNESGPQPILVTEVLAYCTLMHCWREEDRTDLLFFVTKLDIVYLQRTYERIRRDQDDAERKRKAEADRNRRNRRR